MNKLLTILILLSITLHFAKSELKWCNKSLLFDKCQNRKHVLCERNPPLSGSRIKIINLFQLNHRQQKYLIDQLNTFRNTIAGAKKMGTMRLNWDRTLERISWKCLEFGITDLQCSDQYCFATADEEKLNETNFIQKHNRFNITELSVDSLIKNFIRNKERLSHPLLSEKSIRKLGCSGALYIASSKSIKLSMKCVYNQIVHVSVISRENCSNHINNETSSPFGISVSPEAEIFDKIPNLKTPEKQPLGEIKGKTFFQKVVRAYDDMLVKWDEYAWGIGITLVLLIILITCLVQYLKKVELIYVLVKWICMCVSCFCGCCVGDDDEKDDLELEAVGKVQRIIMREVSVQCDESTFVDLDENEAGVEETKSIGG